MANPPGWNNRRPNQVGRNALAPNKARVKLNPIQFDQMIKQQGVRVKVYRSVLCPRVKSIDGAEHDITCPLCRSNQFIDTSPIDTMAFISSQTLEKPMQPEGYVDHASAKATFLQGISLQYFALIEVPDFQDTFYERVKRSRGPLDVLKYKALQVNLIVDEDGQKYYSGNDFNLDQDGNVRWIVSKGPDAAKIYSIHYTITLQFRAVHAMHVNRFAQTVAGNSITFSKMQEEWGIEKVYLADRKDYAGNPLAPNRIGDPDEE